VSTSSSSIIEAHVLDLNKHNINVGIVDHQAHLNFKKFDLVNFGSVELDIGCILNIKNNIASVLDINNRV
jgi:hypothetical protein